jgi:hypothetical protein
MIEWLGYRTLAENPDLSCQVVLPSAFLSSVWRAYATRHTPLYYLPASLFRSDSSFAMVLNSAHKLIVPLRLKTISCTLFLQITVKPPTLARYHSLANSVGDTFLWALGVLCGRNSLLWVVRPCGIFVVNSLSFRLLPRSSIAVSHCCFVSLTLAVFRCHFAII